MFATAPSIVRSARRWTASFAGLGLAFGLTLTAAPSATAAADAAIAVEAIAQDGPMPEAGPRPPVEFELTYAAGITSSFSGTVYVVLGAGTAPQNVPRPFAADVIIAADVTDWKPNTPLRLNAETARSAPVAFADIEARNYFGVAIMGLVFDAQRPSVLGNVQSRTTPIGAPLFDSMPIKMLIDRPVSKPPARVSPRIFTEDLPSELLTTFHGYPVTIGTTVVVPPGYEFEPDRHYPSRIWIGQNGFNHRVGPRNLGSLEQADGGNDHITVIVEVDTVFGHPLFVDSDTTGPWASALLQEVLPTLEAKYRIDPAARFLNGHAAGSWAGLHLQLRYPDAFAGTFAVSPFPVDFSHFHGMDLYSAKNMYRTADGTPRALGIRADGQPVEPAVATWRREDITASPWGPLRSFESAFSPLTMDGLPRPLFDRTSGEIDPESVEAWSRFDLVRFVREQGDTLPESLDNAITIWVGARDGYRPGPSIDALVAALAEVGIRVDLRVSPEGTHISVADQDQKREVYRVIRDRYAEMQAAADDAG
ncbi:MAG: alpha/beta hydrolase-fold protein [Phycisphaerales bacterium]